MLFTRIRRCWNTEVLLLGMVTFSSVHFSSGFDVDQDNLARSLRNQIMSRYNKTIPPSFADSPTDVGIVLVLTRMVGLDEATATMTLEAYLLINWVDRRLSWQDDPTYANISWISINPKMVWIPKLNIFNNGRGIQYGNTEVPMFCGRNGKVWWTVAVELHPVCMAEDLRWFPVDSHNCSIALGALYPQDFFSFMFDDTSLNSQTSALDRSIEIESPHWSVMSVEYEEIYTFASAGMYYPAKSFRFVVRRQRSLLLLAFLPLMVSCTVFSWCSLSLSSSGMRRLTLSTAAVFFHVYFLLQMAKAVPGVARTASPVIIKMATSCCIFAFMTSLYNILMPNLFPKSTTDFGLLLKLPAKVQVLLGIRNVQKPLDVQGLVEEEETNSDGLEQMRKEPSVSPVTRDQVIQAYDRIHLVLQVTAFVIVSLFVSFL